MSEGFIARGFRGRREPSDTSGRLPPGQYLERGFPVLSAGPTPHTPLSAWDFSLVGQVDQPKRWSWDEFRALPRETVTKDIHCPRDAQRAVPSAEVASQDRSMLSLGSDKGRDRTLREQFLTPMPSSCTSPSLLLV
jgi:hypothetical protein